MNCILPIIAFNTLTEIYTGLRLLHQGKNLRELDQGLFHEIQVESTKQKGHDQTTAFCARVQRKFKTMEQIISELRCSDFEK